MAETLDAYGLGVALQAETIEVAVAPDEGGFEAGEMIEDERRADVAAVDEKFSAAGLQKLHRFGHGVGAVVGVGEEGNQHSWLIVATQKPE